MKKWKSWGPGLLLVTPSLAALGLFVYGFIGWNAKVSMTDWNKGLLKTDNFVGLDNYLELFGDEVFHNDVRNLTIFTVVFIGGSMGLGLLLALLMDKGVRGENVLRSIFLFPMAISFIATGVVWRWLLNSDTDEGVTGINDLLGIVGLHSEWHKANSPWAIAAIALPAGWALSGYVMALFLAGLRGIPEELREAARVDGASEARVYWHVVRPMMTPVVLSALVILAHISLKTFDLLWSIAPRDAKVETPAVRAWIDSFGGGFFAKGAAQATLLFLMIAFIVIPYIWYSTCRETRR